MLKLLILACLLGMAMGSELYATTYYAPGHGHKPPAVVYARSPAAAVLPLAYARYYVPATGSEVHTYNSVETPNSFQQQYRSDYKPLTYEYVY